MATEPTAPDDAPILPQGVTLRAFDDTKAARQGIYDGTLAALKTRFPLENKTYRLELSNVRYTGPQDFTLAQQKAALLGDKPLHTPVSGHFRLVRKTDNAVVDEKDEVVMNVPYYTDRGTIINNGSEYTVANQLRLRPGVYTRVRRSGDVETQFNVKPGTGRGFRLRMEPSTGVVTVNVGHANMPLYPLLKTLGVTDKEMIKAWGAEVAHANAAKADSVAGRSAVDKLYQAFAGYNATAQDLVSKETYLRDTLPKFVLDPGVTSRTLGIAAAGITPQVLLRAAAKMFNVNRGEEEADDRDNPGFANVFGIDDLYRERIEKDAGKLGRTLMMKISRAGSLKPVQRGAFSGWHHELLQGSGLAMPGDNSNPMALEEQMLRVTRMGEGGIGSSDVVTDEARQVNSGNLNFIDPVSGPENEKIGVDARLGVHTRKGSDGKLYSLFLNRRGKKEYVACDTASDSVIGFPNPGKDETHVPAMKHGRVQMVPRDEVDYFMPDMAGMFSSNINLNPMPTAVQGGRQFYGSKFWGQYLPAANGEVPLVDSLMPDGKMTWSEHYGRKLGTLRSPVEGTVTKVTDKGVTVTDADGKKHFVETVTNFPFNGLTGLTYTPTVKAGDVVKADDMVAASNFVDKKTGGLAMGVNLKMAWLPYKGFSYEDAIVLSASAAKKIASNRLYGFEADPRDGSELGLAKYMSAFPQKFTKEQYATLDDNGVVKPGTVLNKGDPISVAVGPKLLTAEDANLGKLSKVLRGAFTDKAQIWEHDYPGTVVESGIFRGRAKVNVQAAPPLGFGDKACYDEKTDVLTSSGWKPISTITLDDNVATLNPETGEFDYIRPEVVHKYEHTGDMYRLKNSCIDLLVTTNHRMFVQQRGRQNFEFIEAKKLIGKRVSYKKDGIWKGTELSTFTFPAYTIGHRWGLLTRPEVTIGMDAFLALLGMFLSEGSCFSPKRGGSFAGSGISIAQKKADNVRRCQEALDMYGIKYNRIQSYGFRINGRHLYNYFSQFGHASEKYIPDFVFGLSPRQQRIVFDWMMWGDGHSAKGLPKSYTTTSARLADDFQRLCLHIGIAARICDKQPAGHVNGKIGDRTIVTKHDSYTVQIINKKLTPTVNHGHVSSQHVQDERIVQYSGQVYCCTMPKWHAIYVRRNGHTCWCGNSPRFALKGVIGRVVDDDKMPRDAVTNEPYDILMNPLGIPSRVAPGQLIETALGKLAKATGQPIRLPQDAPPEGWAQWASDQLAAAGVSPTTDVFDPETGRTLKGIGDGYVYFHGMHHLADKKISAKGGAGGYTADLQPAKGGHTGAKRMCFVASQPIRVLHGEESIGHIVEKKIPAYVWTRNQDGTWGYALVTNWFCRKGKVSEVISITVTGLPGSDNCNRKRVVYTDKTLNVTRQHHVFSPTRGEILAGDVRPGEWLTSYGYVPTDDQMSLLIGSMMGDAAICNVNDNIRKQENGCCKNTPYFSEQHSHHQDMYVRWKYSKLGSLVSSRGFTQKKSKAGFSYAPGTDVYYYEIHRHDISESLKNMFYRQADGTLGKKNIWNVDLDALGDVGIVAWFIDDGCITDHVKNGVPTGSPTGTIATNGFTEAENNKLATWLTRRLGAHVTVRHSASTYKGERRHFTFLGLSADACRVMARLVARYMHVDDIPTSKKWLRNEVSRLTDEYVGVNTACRLGSIPVLVTSVSPYTDSRHGPDDEICLYDITVDGAHKYCASDCLVSNSGLDVNALIAHGATENMKDFVTIRGTKNEDYWKSVRSGGPLPEPQVPFIYQKALNLLRAGGINVVEGQRATDILPMTDADTEKLTGGRVIQNSKMLDADLKELKGGLFDPYLTGGNANRDRWAAIQLPEPVPNPVMEEPVRRILGLTGKKLQAVLSGEETLNGLTGGKALQAALAAIDVDAEIAKQRELVRKTRGSARDNAVKVLGYLVGCQKQGVTPKDWMVTKIPVIPPMFRPVAKIGDTALISDLNELYRDVIESADAFMQLKKDVPDAGLTEERLNVYKAVKAAYGLGEAISPEGQAKRLKGAIRQVIGTSPKLGTFQSKVISKAVDGVGRAVISPEPNYDMDQCGIPEDTAWTLYKDYVIRGLVRRGYPQERATQLVTDKAPVAKDLLLEEMGRRPVILDRAPTWHKFNFMAFWPSIVEGNTMRMNPLVEKAFTADHDGDDQIGEVRFLTNIKDFIRFYRKNGACYCKSAMNMIYLCALNK